MVTVFALVALASASWADEFGDAKSCFDDMIETNQPVASCVQDAQAICLSHDAPSLAGADCYRRAKEHWGTQIAARMDQIKAVASEDVSVIAGIEVKYDLKGNLMQCDRMEELSLVRKDPDDETIYTRMRCQASAVGLAYAKLYYQSHSIQ